MALSFAKIILFLGVVLAVGCTSKAPPRPEIRLFTWSEYFKPEELAAFEKETGIKTKIDYYSSNEEMLTKIQLTADGEGYDLILPSDYMVRTMIELRLLSKLDPSKLPFLADFPEEGRRPPYDPELSYSVPLAVGLTGLAWNSKLLPKLPKDLGWKEFFTLPELKGKVTVLDDTKETLQAALLVAGKDLSTATAEDVKRAFAYLKEHKEQLKGFTSETRSAILADECALCMAYSGDVLAVAADKPEIHFVEPKDGLSIWSDNFAIPANAPNKEAAYLFMKKVLSPEGARAFTSRTHYRTFQEKARALLSKQDRENPVIFPKVGSPSYHYLIERKDLVDLVDRAWALLKSY
jgi:spermidine/putrescine transport system substrate-binding protein